MNKISLLLLFLIITAPCFAQTWTTAQLDAANTAKDVAYLTDVEKEAIMYINLARLYPKAFADYEVANYFGTKKYGDYLKASAYRESLITTLKSMQAVKALLPDSALYENAKCFAKELGDRGETGHTRQLCKKENYAECLSYGMDTGKDITMQWLIDHAVLSVGHRKLCLSPVYARVGLSTHAHKKWDICAVAEFAR